MFKFLNFNLSFTGIGQNLGCNQDRGSTDDCDIILYPNTNYGYRDPNGRFRTIMAKAARLVNVILVSSWTAVIEYKDFQHQMFFIIGKIRTFPWEMPVQIMSCKLIV